MIVADTNIIAYRCIRSPLSPAAVALGLRDPDWHAPLLWRSEFRNVLAGEMRRQNMTLERAMDVMAVAAGYIGECEHQVESEPVLRLIAETECTAYDLEFVALAHKLGVRLVTMDRKLLRAFPELAVPLTPV